LNVIFKRTAIDPTDAFFYFSLLFIGELAQDIVRFVKQEVFVHIFVAGNEFQPYQAFVQESGFMAKNTRSLFCQALSSRQAFPPALL
jgi:hypothetical protein